MVKFNFPITTSILLLLCIATSIFTQVSSKTIAEEPGENSIKLEAELEKPIENARSRFIFSKLFNFELFKTVFKRTYNSILEEMARKRLYLARALRVFLSAVSYKRGKISSYLAINSMSDWTPGEIKRLYLDGRVFLEKLKEKFKGINFEEEEEDIKNDRNYNNSKDEGIIPAIDENEIEQNFEWCAENPDEPGFKEIVEELENDKHRRRKRSSSETKHDLVMDDLFREPKSSGDNELTDRVPSNNPNYIPPELKSFGAESDQTLGFMPKSLASMIVNAPGYSFAANVFRTISSNFLGAPKAPPQNVYIENVDGPPVLLQYNQKQPVAWLQIIDEQPSLLKLRQQEALKKYEDNYHRQQSYKRRCIQRKPSVRNSPPPSPDVAPLPHNPPPEETIPIILPDEVFIDHRDSNCLLEVRSQGRCGACYSFAVIAAFEFTYCKQTGNKVAFSEQYVIDCGNYVGLEGCDGGVFTTVSDFVDTFGLELRANYPYRRKADECPYEEEQIKNNPESLGYLRVKEQEFQYISILKAEKFLKDKPLVINVKVHSQFSEYGGGVDESEDCQTNVHSMLLIGSGREDGKEYWLIRNSHGSNWGQGGYYKMSKKSTCISPKFGYLLAASFDGNITKNVNENYNPEKIKRRYWDYMKSDVEVSTKKSRFS